MSKTRSVRPWLRIISVVGAVLLLSAAVLPGADHDLYLLGLSANPNPLPRGCSTSLSANILINGTQDFTLASGSAEIRFYWANGASAMPSPSSSAGWSPAATLPVTWAASDGPFAAGREWPTQFPSMAGASVSWTVPESVSSIYLRAEVVYTAAGVSDEVAANNYMAAAVSTVEGNCTNVPGCHFVGDDLMICLGPWEIRPEELRCLIDPDCPPYIFRDLCEICPKCCIRYEYDPWEFPWEILIGQPDDIMHLELLYEDRLMGVSEPLEKPIRIGRQVYYQVMRLKDMPKKDLDYSLRVIAGPKVEQEMTYPLILNRMPPDRDQRMKQMAY
jgi:hypothetical protein